ncbi:uncharacterized protein YukE [Prauserella isguenensis]|uniref:Uncharacterized protein YukE n=1 Tax=Prauserella isguenensis TaxID=1470180 RepID=A0A839RUQ1_9PSEU|nr:uncharacterized protein YukE [Prauserella isguenensis]
MRDKLDLHDMQQGEEPMAGGQTVDVGKLRAAGDAYTQDGGQLKEVGGRLETDVGEAQVGKAWSDTAKPYAEAIKKYRDAVTKYGEQAADLGDNMKQAAKAYEDGETVNAETIASKGV